MDRALLAMGDAAPATMTVTATTKALLVWVHTGTAVVVVDGVRHDIARHRAVLVPAGACVGIQTSRGTAAIPIWLDDDIDAVRTIDVPVDCETYLLYLFALGLGYLRSDAERAVGYPQVTSEDTATVPPAPTSEDLRRLVRSVENDLGRSIRLSELAAAHGMSARTVQRRFTAEIGMSYSRWLRHKRVAASVALLDEGRPIAWIARQVGFADSSAYARAFKEVVGDSPRRFRTTLRGGSSSREGVERRHVLGDLVNPVVPRTRTWPRINGAHVAVWVCSGTALVSVGDRTWNLVRGDAMLLPAGSPNSVCTDPDSLVLPLGFRPSRGVPLTVDMIAPHRFSDDDLPVLLHGVVATYTTLRPQITFESALFDLVASRTIAPAVPDSGAGQIDVMTVLAEIARSPRDRVTVGELGRRLSLTATDVNRAVNAATGLDFVVWRRKARMTYAREALIRGVPPVRVAREVGYAHLSAFSRAFTSTYGMSPRLFLTRSEAFAVGVRDE